MIISPIDPGDHTWLNPIGISQLAWLSDIGDEGGGYDIGQCAQDERAPGTVPLA